MPATVPSDALAALVAVVELPAAAELDELLLPHASSSELPPITPAIPTAERLKKLRRVRLVLGTSPPSSPYYRVDWSMSGAPGPVTGGRRRRDPPGTHA